MAIEKSIEWVDNETRLNAQNMNSISIAIDTIGSALYGDNDNGLINTVNHHNAWFIGDTVDENSGVFKQMRQIGQIVLTPAFSGTNNNQVYSSSSYDYSTLVKHITRVPNCNGTDDWNTTHWAAVAPIELQFQPSDGPLRSLIGPPVPAGDSGKRDIGESYIDVLADCITWNYNNIVNIGSIYRRNGIYFSNSDTISPYIEFDNSSDTKQLKVITPSIRIAASKISDEAFLMGSADATTVGNISKVVYIGGVDGRNNKLFTVDNTTKEVISTSILPVHADATLGSTTSRWTHSYIANIDASYLFISGTASIDGATTVGSTLAVTGPTTLGDALTVTKGGLTVSGPTTLKNSLTVTNGATLNSTLTVKGKTTLSDELAVSKNTTLSGTLTVTGGSTLSGNTIIRVADVQNTDGTYYQGTNASSVVVIGTDDDTNTLKGEIKARTAADEQLAKDYAAADSALQEAIVGNDTDTISNNTLKGVINYANDEINSIRNLLDALEDTDVITTQPSVTLSASAVKAWEVGTDVTPKYSIAFNAGSYQYGPPSTGCTAQSWYAKFNGVEKSTQTGTFDSVHVDDSTNLTLEVNCTYSEGAVPLSDLGREIPSSRIKSGTTAKKTATLTGFRQAFAGGMTSKTTVLDSKNIRLLSTKSTNTETFDVAITKDAIRVVVAFPDSWGSLTKALDVNDSNKNIVTSFQAFGTVDVSGATEGLDEIPYKLYVMDFASAYGGSGNTYKITIG